ncbi:nucleobase:cation symporter-1, NCS1 family [Sulfobacillus thermosulfidooxidans DSM 9293]|uniref:Nucleobase:cation symporter-1, NCS1 family n=2 Tax=Sulfobacillus thermosulfidooxidans TaxID=28034 RepID=A0A1W1WHL6_SULTA|nr:cytosine permease [Sulfobacillus thermosulfidooxidans]PSR24907.1 MAG: cytosine permease [Sulfobacillus thermosulfidooxidans]SMC05746.1 nucleobase:cation symporter-1, NCS1 family [Sulfobacillus thermosulfidooxidans DSM 9293]
MSELSAVEKAIERHSYDVIPLTERHGTPKWLFFMWYGINAQIFVVATGALGVLIGLNFWGTVLAIVVGNLVGSIFMALHSAQGPKLGLPQMIQSRAQFGFYGSLWPLFIVWAMYVIFAATNIVMAGQAFQAVYHGSVNLWAAIMTIPMILIAIFGYDWIHYGFRYATWLYSIVFIVLTIMLLVHGLPAHDLAHGKFTWGNFFLALSIYATWQISYSPYVSDYSRYLSPNLATHTFWATFWGTNIGSIWLMILGAALAALNPAAQTLSAIQGLGGHSWGTIIALLLGIGQLIPGAVNIYGGAIVTLSAGSNIRPFESTRMLRSIVALVVGILSALIAIAGSGHFMTNVENFLLFLMYFLIPWTAINLTDFYWIHRGNYKIADLFSPKGVYGRWGWPALIVYTVTFLIEVPFMNTTVYQGPISKALGGADISWIIGLIVAVPLYYWADRKWGKKDAISSVLTDREPQIVE